jgi:hypothetical protein
MVSFVLTPPVVVMVCEGFEVPGLRVFCYQYVIVPHMEGPLRERASEPSRASAIRSTGCNGGLVRRSGQLHKKASSWGAGCRMSLSKGIFFLEAASVWYS